MDIAQVKAIGDVVSEVCKQVGIVAGIAVGAYFTLKNQIDNNNLAKRVTAHGEQIDKINRDVVPSITQQQQPPTIVVQVPVPPAPSGNTTNIAVDSVTPVTDEPDAVSGAS